jgi:hypothetical protein
LQDHAALFSPILLQRKDQFLKCRRCFLTAQVSCPDQAGAKYSRSAANWWMCRGRTSPISSHEGAIFSLLALQ